MTQRSHLLEYLMEAFGLALVMVSAGVFAILLCHPNSPVPGAVPDPLVRRALMGLAMGLTAVVNIYSPWGKRSGAHYNPATTLTFWRLGKVSGRDAAFYTLSQFAGAVAGVLLVALTLRSAYLDPPVLATVTRAGPAGEVVAFLAEAALAFVLISVVLAATNSPRLAPYTGLAVGLLVAVYITIEDPLSGMSMNPARSFAPAVVSGTWDGLWVYFAAPPFGMLLAAQLYVWRKGRAAVRCAKMHHDNPARCIFCGKPAGPAAAQEGHDESGDRSRPLETPRGTRVA
jgi:aquaporin Z